MNDKIKQLWWDIQHYGEVLSKIDKFNHDGSYTERLHKYQDETYKSIMLNGELIELFRLFICDGYSHIDGRKLADKRIYCIASFKL